VQAKPIKQKQKAKTENKAQKSLADTSNQLIKQTTTVLAKINERRRKASRNG